MALPRPQVGYIYLCRLDAHRNADGSYDHKPLKVMTASMSPWPLDTEWGTYIPVGESLTLQGFGGSTDLSADGFSLTLNGVTPEVVRFARDEKSADNDVCVHRADGIIGADGYWKWNEPFIVALGHVSQITINAASITAECYTASTDLDAVVGHATHWTDVQQKKFVNAQDNGFEECNRYFNDKGIETSWA